MKSENKEIIVIAGGFGLLGTALVNMIDKEKYKIIILSRSLKKAKQDNCETALWDPEKNYISKIPVPDIIINLAGEGIADKRWSKDRKKVLISSRINSALTIKNYLEENNIKPKLYLSASAVGYYGNRGDEFLTEASSPGNEFLSDCCHQWEKAATSAGASSYRTVILRIGIVLTTLGGALPKMILTGHFGILNYFGSGNQFYPWIHIEDLCRLIIECIEKEEYTGIYNAVAPQLINNKELMLEIKKSSLPNALVIPVPAFILKLLMGEMSKVVLNSTKIIPERIKETKFHFNFTSAGSAVQNLISRKK